MPKTISIVTPWHGETGAALAGDYFQAVQGSAQVITVDNACPQATATILSEMTAQLCGEYVRSETNLGFAGGNNAGYAAATGDIVIFLNSDVAPLGPWLHHVARDVKDGAIYGPSLQQQLVAGHRLPYLEGWCIAATRQTWEALVMAWNCEHRMGYGEAADEFMVWDAVAYPGPYWEDNDLALRALQVDISLVQTAWPIAHKGGATAGPVIRHAESFAKNERTFTQRALAAIAQPKMTDLWQRYMQQCYTQSDIQHHLPLLFSLARGNVVELGTRSGVSTTALLAGVEAHGGHVTSVDIEPCGHLFDHPQWTFCNWDSRYPDQIIQHCEDFGGPDPAGISLLLIDTEHQYDVTRAELAAWAPFMKAGGHILLHDTETYPGVRRAVEEFCAARGWEVTWVLPCHGMAVVEVPNQPEDGGFAGASREPWEDGIGNML